MVVIRTPEKRFLANGLNPTQLEYLRVGIVRDQKMILKILAPDQHAQGGLIGAPFQNHQDYLCSTAVHRLTKHGGHVYDLRTYLFQGS
jgi:hypothetical protein